MNEFTLNDVHDALEKDMVKKLIPHNGLYAIKHTAGSNHIKTMIEVSESVDCPEHSIVLLLTENINLYELPICNPDKWLRVTTYNKSIGLMSWKDKIDNCMMNGTKVLLIDNLNHILDIQGFCSITTQRPVYELDLYAHNHDCIIIAGHQTPYNDIMSLG